MIYFSDYLAHTVILAYGGSVLPEVYRLLRLSTELVILIVLYGHIVLALVS